MEGSFFNLSTISRDMAKKVEKMQKVIQRRWVLKMKQSLKFFI